MSSAPFRTFRTFTALFPHLREPVSAALQPHRRTTLYGVRGCGAEEQARVLVGFSHDPVSAPFRTSEFRT